MCGFQACSLIALLPCFGSHHAVYVLFFYSAEPHLSLSCANKVSITSDGVLWKTHILLPFTTIPPPNCLYQVEHSCWPLTSSSSHPSKFSSTKLEYFHPQNRSRNLHWWVVMGFICFQQMWPYITLLVPNSPFALLSLLHTQSDSQILSYIFHWLG